MFIPSPLRPLPICIPIILFTILLHNTAPAAKIVRLTTGEWPPYISQNLPGKGVGLLIISEAFKLAGYDVEYSFYPWPRGYELGARGQWDGSVLWQKTPGRSKELLFSDRVILCQNCTFLCQNGEQAANSYLKHLIEA